jgi:hypothetical protein
MSGLLIFGMVTLYDLEKGIVAGGCTGRYFWRLLPPRVYQIFIQSSGLLATNKGWRSSRLKNKRKYNTLLI